MDYRPGQTLRHKTHDILARLDEDQDTAFASAKSTARLTSEHGERFTDKIGNWLPIKDELGRPCLQNPRKGQFVAHECRKYLTTPLKLAAMRDRTLYDWCYKLRQKLKKAHRVQRPFSLDGFFCWQAEQSFLMDVEATPAWKEHKSLEPKKRTNLFQQNAPWTFRLWGRQWAYMPQPVHQIVEITLPGNKPAQNS